MSPWERDEWMAAAGVFLLAVAILAAAAAAALAPLFE